MTRRCAMMALSNEDLNPCAVPADLCQGVEQIRQAAARTPNVCLLHMEKKGQAPTRGVTRRPPPPS